MAAHRTPFYRPFLTPLFILILLAICGCETMPEGPPSGYGLGEVIARLAGPESRDVLIGGAVGDGVGYVIGDPQSLAEAQKLSADPNYKPQTAPLAGTRWSNLDAQPKPDPKFRSFEIEFRPDGTLVTTASLAKNEQMVTQEHYRVEGNTLIINDPGYLVNAKYSYQDGAMVISAGRFRGVVQRAAP